MSIPPIGHFRLHLIRMFSTCKRELVVFHSLSRLGVVSRSWFSLCMSNISLGPFQHGYALLFISLQGGTLLFTSPRHELAHASGMHGLGKATAFGWPC